MYASRQRIPRLRAEIHDLRTPAYYASPLSPIITYANHKVTRAHALEEPWLAFQSDVVADMVPEIVEALLK